MKGPPYHPKVDVWDPQYSFNEDDARFLGDLNVNSIRLGMMWPGVEPVRGQYNYTYINIMKGIVENCQKYGIYVILNMHQDGLSEKFCGEGIPLWAVDTDTPLDILGLNLPKSIVGFPFPISNAPFPNRLKWYSKSTRLR